MNLLLIADLHSEEITLKKLQKHLSTNSYDAILLAGDLVSNGPVSYAKEFIEICKGYDVFFVRGNNDPQEVADLFINNIDGKCIKFQSYTFCGVGGSTYTHANTINEKSEQQLLDELNNLKINSKTILVTHNPPFGYFDEVAPDIRKGSSSVLKIIEQKQPLINVSGHIHSGYGHQKLGKTNIISTIASIMNGAMKITINDQTNDVQSTEITL